MKPIESDGDDVILKVRVRPRASGNFVKVNAEGSLCVSLTAPPHDGEANEALTAFLAKQLGVAKSRICLVRGEKSREKAVRVKSVKEGWVRAALGILGPRPQDEPDGA